MIDVWLDLLECIESVDRFTPNQIVQFRKLANWLNDATEKQARERRRINEARGNGVEWQS